jgi:hypothetical protein
VACQWGPAGMRRPRGAHGRGSRDCWRALSILGPDATWRLGSCGCGRQRLNASFWCSRARGNRRCFPRSVGGAQFGGQGRRHRGRGGHVASRCGSSRDLRAGFALRPSPSRCVRLRVHTSVALAPAAWCGRHPQIPRHLRPLAWFPVPRPPHAAPVSAFGRGAALLR